MARGPSKMQYAVRVSLSQKYWETNTAAQVAEDTGCSLPLAYVALRGEPVGLSFVCAVLDKIGGSFDEMFDIGKRVRPGAPFRPIVNSSAVQASEHEDTDWSVWPVSYAEGLRLGLTEEENPHPDADGGTILNVHGVYGLEEDGSLWLLGSEHKDSASYRRVLNEMFGLRPKDLGNGAYVMTKEKAKRIKEKAKRIKEKR